MSPDEKAAAVKQLQEQGLGTREIGERFGVSHTTVSKWLQRARPNCARCENLLVEAVADGLCGFCREEAVLALSRPAPASTFAIWNLRELGYSAEAAVRALREAREGTPPGEIASAFAGAAKTEARPVEAAA